MHFGEAEQDIVKAAILKFMMEYGPEEPDEDWAEYCGETAEGLFEAIDGALTELYSSSPDSVAIYPDL